MKQFFTFSILIFLLTATTVFGQYVNPEVISSGGEHNAVAGLQLSWTVGETVIETFDSGPTQLTQGFHQPVLMITSLNEPDGLPDMHIYPNPASGLINIEFNQLPAHIHLLLFDATGRQLMTKKVIDQNTAVLDLSAFPAGAYFLSAYDQASSNLTTFKIQKIK